MDDRMLRWPGVCQRCGRLSDDIITHRPKDSGMGMSHGFVSWIVDRTLNNQKMLMMILSNVPLIRNMSRP